ncbi:MAG: HAD-IB family hydrolase [Bacteroidetes bacterium]|nr:HAD-IB family hydrolase [Bacteroidota bacterium]
MNQKKAIAFFDFDGTLITADSFWKFLQFTQSTPRLVFGAIVLSPILVLFKLKLLGNSVAKKAVMKHFFKGMPKEDFNAKCVNFSESEIKKWLNAEMLQKLKRHQELGHNVCLVSASLEDYLQPWCSQLNISCLATKMTFKDGHFEGNYAKPNCWGPEKERRIKQAFNLEEYDAIYAYGDSRGDREMLALRRS